jgi:hypothetical protein
MLSDKLGQTGFRVRPTRPTLLMNRRTIVAILTIGAASLAVLASVASFQRDALPVVRPLVASIFIAMMFIVTLWNRDGRLPVFELGSFVVATTTLYAIVPLAGFWLGGLQWTQLSYLPLILHNPSPSEVGNFAWRYVLYIGFFALAYLSVRGRPRLAVESPRTLDGHTTTIVVVMLVLLTAYFWILQAVFGVVYNPTYSELLAGTVPRPGVGLPYILQQISHNLFSMITILKLGVIMLFLARWHDLRWRVGIAAWLALEAYGVILRMGARTYAAMLVVGAILLYDRMVRPISFRAAVLVAVALLTSVIGYGLSRDVIGGVGVVFSGEASPWTTMNEFQAYFGIAYDMYVRKAADTLGHIPSLIYWNDLILLIPSQLLPFTKLDPCFGFPVVDGAGLGCVVGVVTYSVIGFDWLELAVRGAVLGSVFAAVHRWYARRQHSYWATLFYLCLCLWSYYTFRASTFYFVYLVTYTFLPMFVAVQLIRRFGRSEVPERHLRTA